MENDKILVAEDDKSIREMLIFALETEEVEVDSVKREA